MKIVPRKAWKQGLMGSVWLIGREDRTKAAISVQLEGAAANLNREALDSKRWARYSKETNI